MKQSSRNGSSINRGFASIAYSDADCDKSGSGSQVYVSGTIEAAQPVRERRRARRLDIQCRAKIHIGRRHYAGYVHNISRTGAKLRTISPIRRAGTVILYLPDLPPLKCELRWTDFYNAGVAFKMSLSASEFRDWAQSRLTFPAGHEGLECTFTELPDLFD